MCGIVGYIGDRNATPIIIDGLEKLEYRGYDSAGIAVIDGDTIKVRRDSGKISHLKKMVSADPITGTPGIGHTRWATHGEPSERNAHPHIGYNGKVVLVHNGIVENYLELKDELISEGVEFQSETDTETIVHLIEKNLDAGFSLAEAVRRTLHRIKGSHGVVVLSSTEPDHIIAARIGNAGGVVIGLGEGENFIASDIPAILSHTNKMVFLESEQMAVLSKDTLDIMSFEGDSLNFTHEVINWDPISAVKGTFRHFMQKEIHEQGRSTTDTLAGRIDFKHSKVLLPQLNASEDFLKKITQIKIIACGTANHAGLVGKYLIEEIAKVPVEVDIASEFRYRNPIIDPGTVVVAISQSGETADTLAAMEEAKKKGATVWSIVNAIGSQAMRYADGYIGMQTGPEIGVASTKAFTAPLIDLFLLAVLLADARGVIDENERITLIREIGKVPDLVSKCLEREQDVKIIAARLKDYRHMLYLGRGINMPIAYEGALKLKEISYIHAEAYPAGEMKHGPIALIDKQMPILAIMPNDRWYEKMRSQVEQAKARGGRTIIIAADGDEGAREIADDVLWVPRAHWLINPILTVIPLQMLAYHIAVMRGLDVDQPRNLAKSVTVE